MMLFFMFFFLFFFSDAAGIEFDRVRSTGRGAGVYAHAPGGRGVFVAVSCPRTSSSEPDDGGPGKSGNPRGGGGVSNSIFGGSDKSIRGGVEGEGVSNKGADVGGVRGGEEGGEECGEIVGAWTGFTAFCSRVSSVDSCCGERRGESAGSRGTGFRVGVGTSSSVSTFKSCKQTKTCTEYPYL